MLEFGRLARWPAGFVWLGDAREGFVLQAGTPDPRAKQYELRLVFIMNTAQRCRGLTLPALNQTGEFDLIITNMHTSTSCKERAGIHVASACSEGKVITTGSLRATLALAASMQSNSLKIK